MTLFVLLQVVLVLAVSALALWAGRTTAVTHKVDEGRPTTHVRIGARRHLVVGFLTDGTRVVVEADDGVAAHAAWLQLLAGTDPVGRVDGVREHGVGWTRR